jgi:hypothetical protein
MGEHPSRLVARDPATPGFQTPSSRAVARAAALDAAAVLLFAGIGRASHTEGVSPLGVVLTAWPFVAGAALGWAAAWSGYRRPPLSPLHGIPVWLGAVGLGMALRALTGHGVAPAFVLVASAALGLLLLGWRAAATRLVARG